MDLAVAAAGNRRLASVRAWWRVRHPPPSLGRRLDIAYTTALVAGIFGAVAYGTAGSALAEVMTPARLETYGPPAALVALVLLARWGAYQGPVVFTVADVGILLGAPLPRRGLAIRRLALGLAAGAAGGAVLAGLLIVGLAGKGRGIAVRTAAGLAAGAAALAVLGVAAAWAVERSARWERAVRLATWPAFAAAVGLAAWAPAVPWAAALIVVAVVAALAATRALAGCAHCPAERHLRRAEAREGAVASLYNFDLRTARRSLEAAGPRAAARNATASWLRAILPPIPWRDTVSALRTPGRVLEAVVLAAAGAGLAVRDSDRPLVVAAAMLAGYAAPARMLWPLRAELDMPDRPRVLLRQPTGQVILEHTFVPAAVAAAGAVVGVAAAALAGRASAATALTAVAVAPLLTLCAAMSARRGGRVAPSVLVTALAADPSGGAAAVVGWFALWPSVAVVLAAVPVLLADAGAAVVGLTWIAIAALALARMVRSEPRDR